MFSASGNSQTLQPTWSNRSYGLVLALALLTVCGCNQAGEDQEHQDHELPAHMPLNYAMAVEQLQVRGQELLSGAIEPVRLTELRDIIGWLPEIAADSDLRRQSWEQVHGVATELIQIADDSRPAAQKSRWQRSISILEALIPEADLQKASVPSDDSALEPTATTQNAETVGGIHD